MRNSFEAELEQLRIEAAASDPRIREVVIALLFPAECPEGRIFEASYTADVAEHYGLDPDAMQRVFAVHHGETT